MHDKVERRIKTGISVGQVVVGQERVGRRIRKRVGDQGHEIL